MKIDDTHYPIVLTTSDPGATPEDIERFFAKMRALGDRAIREDSYYVAIAVVSVAFAPLLRAKIAEEVKKTSQVQLKRSIGTFAVVSSPVVRGALTAAKWMAPESLRTVTPVATWEEAMDLAISALRAKGVPLPATIGRLRVRAAG
jgi:hypothetical protein